jgi:hypothetical protein
MKVRSPIADPDICRFEISGKRSRNCAGVVRACVTAKRPIIVRQAAQLLQFPTGKFWYLEYFETNFLHFFPGWFFFKLDTLFKLRYKYMITMENDSGVSIAARISATTLGSIRTL